MNCSKCRYELFKNFKFCYECGTKIININRDDIFKTRNARNWSKFKCSKCKSFLYSNARFCHKCGADVSTENKLPTRHTHSGAKDSKAQLTQTLNQIEKKYREINTEKLFESDEAERVNKSLIIEVFKALQDAEIDPTNVESMRVFIDNLQESNSDLYVFFVDAFNGLIGKNRSTISSKAKTEELTDKLTTENLGHESDELNVAAPETSEVEIETDSEEVRNIYFDKVNEQISPYSNNFFKKKAKYFYNLGLNITCVSDKKNFYNSKEDNIYSKSPNHSWGHLHGSRQTLEEFDSYPWEDATGLGLATGFNDLLVIDIDNCIPVFLKQSLLSLGLPENYEWAVLSGSGKGFHVYVFVEGLTLYFVNESVIRLFPKVQYIQSVEKTELLVRLHSILPPSIHPSKNKYKFINCSRPKSKPLTITIQSLQGFINTFFDNEKQRNIASHARVPLIQKSNSGEIANSDDEEVSAKTRKAQTGYNEIFLPKNIISYANDLEDSKGARIASFIVRLFYYLAALTLGIVFTGILIGWPIIAFTLYAFYKFELKISDD